MRSKSALRGALALLVGGSLAAGAVTAANALEPSEIDASKAVTLNIHKYSQPTAPGSPGDGTETTTTPAGANPLANIKFKIRKVNEIDIHNNKGWEQATALAEQFKTQSDVTKLTVDSKAITFGTPTEKNTDSNGLSSFSISAAEQGLYLVEEELTAEQIKKGIVSSQPFFVTLPMAKPDHRTWNYDVHVYPKNTETKLTKTVSDTSAVKPGDSVVYNVTGDVPITAAGRNLEKYVISDQLDTKYLDQVTKDNVTVTSNKVALTPAYYNITTDANKVRVEFTAEGLKQLTEAKNKDFGTQVSVQITAKVKALADADTTGVLKNKAFLYPSNANTESDDGSGGNGVPSNEVESKFAKVKITKHNDKNQPLAGAKFSVFKCTVAGGKATLDGNALDIGGKTEFETAANGEVTISSLHSSSFIDGKAAAETDQIQYCLKETEAPTGFQLLPEPIPFKLLTEGTGANVTNAVHNLPTIKNYPVGGGFQLPLTGSSALVVFSLAGAALLAGGIFLAVRRKVNKH